MLVLCFILYSSWPIAHEPLDGGHYLPTTAAAIMDFNVAVAAGTHAGPALRQFRGLLVGNPYTNPAENSKVCGFRTRMLRLHSYFSGLRFEH